MTRVVPLFALCLASWVLAHPGPIDANGGYFDQNTGVYYLHRSRRGSAYYRSSPRLDARTIVREVVREIGRTLEPAKTTQPRTETYGQVALCDGMSVYVCRVVDGDTLKTDRFTIRLIGVDTPETKDPRKPVQYYGKEASDFTRALTEKKTVTLDFDWNKLDKYQRVLAYVWLDPATKPQLDGMLNYRLIREGYGHAYLRFPFKGEYMRLFREAEEEARRARRGLWGP